MTVQIFYVVVQFGTTLPSCGPPTWPSRINLETLIRLLVSPSRWSNFPRGSYNLDATLVYPSPHAQSAALVKVIYDIFNQVGPTSVCPLWRHYHAPPAFTSRTPIIVMLLSCSLSCLPFCYRIHWYIARLVTTLPKQQDASTDAVRIVHDLNHLKQFKLERRHHKKIDTL